MAEIAPLTPLRYSLPKLRGDLGDVVAPPYDVISREERAALAERDPHNVVRLILPEGDGDAKYAHAADLLQRWRDEAVLVRDDEPAFYRYDQTFLPPGQAAGGPRASPIRRRGFLALVRLVPFSDRVVLPHERTLSGPKEDRLKLFRATRSNLSPGFMLYRDARGDLNAPLETGETLTEFSTSDGVRHAVAKVRAPDAVRAIVEGITRSTLLIADGHHRYETALHYSREACGAGGGGGSGPHDRREPLYFMTFLANGDDPELVVFPTHRLVHSLAAFSFEDLVRRASAYFAVQELPRDAIAEAIEGRVRQAGAEGPSVGAAVRDGRVAVLTLRKDVNLDTHPVLGKKPAVLRRTDVTVLHAGLLETVLGITPEAQAAKTNIYYVQDTRDALAQLRSGVRGQVLFVMNATPVASVRDVAEAGEVMPQKSTFFYPKVLTGLALHTLDPARTVATG